MRWARFDQNGTPTYGVVEGDEIIPVRGSPFDMWERTSSRLQLSEVRLLTPVEPPTFYAAGLNYAEHVREAAEKLGLKVALPANAAAGYRANNALIAHGEAIVIPQDATEQVQYEGELVAVIGKKCRKVTEAQALDYVFGYTIGNDVSERKWQRGDRTLWRGKNCDTFKPMGPWIVTGADIDAMKTTIKLNGRVTETFKTNNMIFDAPTYISEVSRYCTIEPGDVMWMGTDGAPENMKHGDVCEVEIPGIGVLRNPVVREGE